jgi:hypothetical protein
MNLTVADPAIDSIISSLNRRETIALTSSNRAAPMGLFARLWRWCDVKFHEERLSKLAAVVANMISQQPRIPIEEATKNPPLKAARILLKEAVRHKVDLPILRKEVTAAKLGITAHTLDNNPGLQQFTEDHHLERYLYIYKDPLQVDLKTHQVALRKEGKFQPWSTISKEIQGWTKPARQPQLAWVYGQDGIQNKDMYDWTELKPFLKGNPADWHHQYVFEFCACHNPQSFKNGNHSWVRLKTPSGDIYSIGLYRPDKMDWTDNLRTPLRIKPGELMQPDVSEFWDYPITTVDFAINEETFLKIKQTIETDKKNEDQIFQLFNNNCVLYNKKLASISGVDLPTQDIALSYMASPSIVQSVGNFMSKLPSFVQKVALYVTAFFLNIGQILLGATIIDDRLNEQQRKKAVPHLNSFFDLFDINKIYFNHPNTLGYKTRLSVLNWRQKEIEALTETDSNILDKRIKEISLSLPPAYYGTSFGVRRPDAAFLPSA